MSSRVLEVLASLGGVAAVSELVASGLSRKACRHAVVSGAAVVVARGVLADREVWLRLDDRARHICLVAAVLRRSGPGAVAAGASAAVVWDLPLPSGPPAAPVVLRRRSPARPESGARYGSAVHRRAWLDDDEVTEVAGVGVTTMCRTVVDVARHQPVAWGLAAADVAMSRGLTSEELAAQVRRMSPMPGSRRAAIVASWADARAESPLESVARATVRLLGLPVPELQVSLAGDGARYRVDLLVPDFRTVIEVDGKVKYDGPERSWQDKRRRDHITTWGHEIERFVAADQHRPVRWGRVLLRAFSRAADRWGLAPPDIDPSFAAYRRLPVAWRVDRP